MRTPTRIAVRLTIFLSFECLLFFSLPKTSFKGRNQYLLLRKEDFKGEYPYHLTGINKAKLLTD